MDQGLIDHRTKVLSQGDFVVLKELAEGELGIQLRDHNRQTLESRLNRRLRVLGLRDFGSYCELVAGPGADPVEREQFIHAVTTHHTFFFREEFHFAHLADVALPQLTAKGAGIERPLLAWSAASSTGEEVYSIAIQLAEHALKAKLGSLDYSVLGTDVSEEVLDRARQAVYPLESTNSLSLSLAKRYFLRSRSPESQRVRVVPELRSRTRFHRLNLAEPGYERGEPMDIIFCRNVMIYFRPEIQQEVVARLVRRLRPGGCLYLGHSESLLFKVPGLKSLGKSIYQKI